MKLNSQQEAGGGEAGVSAFASTEQTTVGDLLEVLDSHNYLVIGTLNVFLESVTRMPRTAEGHDSLYWLKKQ